MSVLLTFFPWVTRCVSFFTPTPRLVVQGSRVTVLVHLCCAQEWSDARTGGQLRPESLTTAGFIHLSTPDQVHLPANRLYRGRSDLVLLYVDSIRLDSPVRWEPGVAADPESMLFPHLYGPLPVEAVIKVTGYRPAADGNFPPATDSVEGAK
jgi:uncharacterized protein (DUF952 family)